MLLDDVGDRRPGEGVGQELSWSCATVMAGAGVMAASSVASAGAPPATRVGQTAGDRFVQTVAVASEPE